MKKMFVFSLLILAMVFLFAGTTLAAPAAGQVEITLTFERLGGYASNQYAVWIEDEAGGYIRTLFATRFTAKGGWKRRPLSLARWIKSSVLPELPPAVVDTLSGATPPSGDQTHIWDCKNDAGDDVSAGKYLVRVEGTLRNEDAVLYTATVEIGGPSTEAEVQTEYFGKETEDRAMLGNVRVRYAAAP